MTAIPISKVKNLANEIGADAVIVIGFFKGDRFATTSYGKDKATCQKFAKVADFIHDDIAHGNIEIPKD